MRLDTNKYFGMYKEQNGRSENSFGKENELDNNEIKKTVFKYRLLYKDIAKRIGITPETMSRWLNTEMKDWQRDLVSETITDMVAEIRKMYEEDTL